MADEDMRNYVTRLRNSLLDLSRRLQCSPNEDTVDYALFRLQQILRHLARLGTTFSGLYRSISAVISLLESVQFVNVDAREGACCSNGSVGRPKFVIPREQLEYMLDYNISVPDIAHALGVSKSTIKRRLREYDLTIRSQQSVLTNEELDDLVRSVQREFPNAGYRRVYSQLKSRSINVIQSRVRESMHRTDPEGVAMRWLNITPRMAYSVRGPLSLWHIDGNHKLIR